MIDTKELRTAVEAAGLNAISTQEVLELLDRLEAAEKERDELLAGLDEWLDKTKWVQQGINEGTISTKYLGLHRADVMTSLLGEAEKERDALRAENAGLVDDMNLLRDNNAALLARIEAKEKQEPVGTLHDDGCFVWRETAPHQSNYAGWKMALYAHPGAHPDPSVPGCWKQLVQELVRELERNTCAHEETHRGGFNWEICDMCGAKWADDKGGKPEFKWPDAVEKARAMLAAAPQQEGE